MTTQQLARADALQNATMRLATERVAIETCRAKGWMTDLRFAEQEAAHLEALIARLRAHAS